MVDFRRIVSISIYRVIGARPTKWKPPVFGTTSHFLDGYALHSLSARSGPPVIGPQPQHTSCTLLRSSNCTKRAAAPSPPAPRYSATCQRFFPGMLSGTAASSRKMLWAPASAFGWALIANAIWPVSQCSSCEQKRSGRSTCEHFVSFRHLCSTRRVCSATREPDADMSGMSLSMLSRLPLRSRGGAFRDVLAVYL